MPTLEELLQQSIELGNEKLALEQKRNELAQKTLEINNLIQEEKKKKELEKTQIVIIEKIQNETVYIDTNGTPRTDVLELLRATPRRDYNYVLQRNLIPIQYWNQFKESLDKLPNIEISYLEKNKEFLESYFSEKLWTVKLSEKYIVIKKAARNKDVGIMSKIPSAAWNTIVKAITVPFSEGWRVIQILPLNEDTEYSPEVLQLIEKQVEQRKKMDEVALKNDADIPNPFTGIDPERGSVYELKPFQRAGVFFAMTALGIEIPTIIKEEKKSEPKPW